MSVNVKCEEIEERRINSQNMFRLQIILRSAAKSRNTCPSFFPKPMTYLSLSLSEIWAPSAHCFFFFLPVVCRRVGRPFILPHLQSDLMCPDVLLFLCSCRSHWRETAHSPRGKTCSAIKKKSVRFTLWNWEAWTLISTKLLNEHFSF